MMPYYKLLSGQPITISGLTANPAGIKRQTSYELNDCMFPWIRKCSEGMRGARALAMLNACMLRLYGKNKWVNHVFNTQ